MAVELVAGEKLPGESKKAIIACNDWLRLGPGRTLVALVGKYAEMHQSTPPTRSLHTLKRWSTDFGWQAREEAYDAAIEAVKNARRREIMESGLALDYERVVKLKTLADFLESQIAEEDPAGKRANVWVKDYKRLGGGEFGETVEIERFNAALIAEFRASLDDLAKETGGRKQNVKMEHSGSVDFTSDDAAKAKEELDAFEQRRRDDAQS
ncbi:MAG: hypothetical protein IT328_04510 [Caldilineaceae bacterium]|nr:hypothetical protein [Caldilineaceae bacterium]